MEFENIIQLTETFKDEQTCRDYLAKLRWVNGKANCPYCKSKKVYKIENGKRFKCANKECHKKFSVTVGTIFENTKIPLRKWFIAIYLITSHKKGISSCQLARDLGITQKSAWFVLHRVREMLKEKLPQSLEGVVEIDETYVGGKQSNKHKSKRIGKQGAHSKTPVVGLVQREGKVRSKAVESGKAKDVVPVMLKNVKPGAVVITDENGMYKNLNGYYQHHSVNHSAEEYVRGSIYTNTIEGYFSLLKRGIIGIYHHVSDKHLSRYLDEFNYRYNAKEDTQEERFAEAIFQSDGRRLKYENLIQK